MTCDGPTNKNCLSCKTNTYYYMKECLLTCIDNTYPEISNFSCVKCHSSCKICNGPSN